MSFLDTMKSALRKKAVNFMPNQWEEYSNTVDNLEYFDQYHSTTFLATNFNANNVASVEIDVINKKKESTESLNSEQLMQDLKYFNPSMSIYEARRLTQIHLSLVGRAVWLKVESPSKNKKYEFEFLDPTLLHIDDHENGQPSVYRYQKNRLIKYFDKTDLVIFSNPDPANWNRSYGTLQASAYSHDTLEEMQKWNRNFFFNNGMPEGFFVLPNANKEQKKRFSEQLKEIFSGRNVRKKGVTSNPDFKYISLMQSQKESDFIEGMQMMIDSVLAIHGIPKALVYPDATNANTQESNRMYQTYTLLPKLELEKNVLERQLLPDYYDIQKENTICFYFSNPVQKDVSKERSDYALLYEKGVITRAEAKEALGLEYEEEDSVYSTELKPMQEREIIREISQQNEEKTTKIVREFKQLKKLFKHTDTAKKAEENYKKQLQELYYKKQSESEKIFKKELNKTILEQGSRITRSIEPRLNTIPNKKSENEYLKEKMKGVFASESQKYSKVANSIAESSISITNETINEGLSVFADQVNETTLNDLRKIVSEGIENDLPMNDIKNSVLQKFNGYIEGQGNIDILEKYGVFKPRSFVKDGEIQAGSGNRFNKMLELIGNETMREQAGLDSLSEEERKKALQALLGIAENSDEDLAETVANQINLLYGESETIETMTESRARLIANDQVNKIKNSTSRYVYESNEDVKGLEWLSANDMFVRDGHFSSQVDPIKKGEEFNVNGESLRYPSDPRGSAKNTINCRCTIIPVMKI